MKNYKQFIIYAKPFNVDLLSGAMWELDILGINEYDDYLVVFSKEESETNEEVISQRLNTLVDSNIIEYYEIEKEILESKNWNSEWEKKINVIDVSDRLVIIPSFREYLPKEGQLVIEIDPKMSFGTGEHQTTRIMLNLVEKYVNVGDKVLDVGSGTSILGIAASKLGAKKVVAVDNDEWCYHNGLENVRLNNITNVDVIEGTVENILENNFDIVLANINKNVLKVISESLYDKVKPLGLLVLSGLLDSDLEEIKKQYTQIGFTALEKLSIDEWIGIVFRKN